MLKQKFRADFDYEHTLRQTFHAHLAELRYAKLENEAFGVLHPSPRNLFGDALDYQQGPKYSSPDSLQTILTTKLSSSMVCRNGLTDF